MDGDMGVVAGRSRHLLSLLALTLGAGRGGLLISCVHLTSCLPLAHLGRRLPAVRCPAGARSSYHFRPGPKKGTALCVPGPKKGTAQA